jgi:hypothetical protein
MVLLTFHADALVGFSNNPDLDIFRHKAGSLSGIPRLA